MSDILRVSLPLTVWLVSFCAVYGLSGGLCALQVDPGTGRLALVAAFIAAILLQIGVLAALSSERLGTPPGFLRRLTLTLALAGVVATPWTLAPVALLPVCG